MGLFSAKPSVNAQKIIGWLGCECEYFPAGKPAQFISSTYEDAFAKKEMGGYTPIIIVVNDVLSEWFDMLREESGTSPEDRRFALKVMEYINKRVSEFKKEDGHLYAIYGTPAENLCGLQIKQFRKKYGIIENVSDREYVSNSFHCHVTEDITPIQKQDRGALLGSVQRRKDTVRPLPDRLQQGRCRNAGAPCDEQGLLRGREPLAGVLRRLRLSAA